MKIKNRSSSLSYKKLGIFGVAIVGVYCFTEWKGLIFLVIIALVFFAFKEIARSKDLEIVDLPNYFFSESGQKLLIDSKGIVASKSNARDIAIIVKGDKSFCDWLVLLPLTYNFRQEIRVEKEFFGSCSYDNLTVVKDKQLVDFLSELKPVSEQLYQLVEYLDFITNEKRLYLKERSKAAWRKKDPLEEEYSFKINRGQQIIDLFRQVLEKYFITVASWESSQIEERQLQLKESIVQLNDFLFNYQKLIEF